MVIKEIEKIVPGMILSKDISNNFEQVLVGKGTQLTEEIIQLLKTNGIFEVHILDVEKLYKIKTQRQRSVKEIISSKYSNNLTSIKNMATMRSHAFQSEVRNFLMPHVMEDTIGLSHLKKIEQIAAEIVEMKKLEIPFAKMVGLYLHTPVYRRTFTVAILIALELQLTYEECLIIAKGALFYNIGYDVLLNDKQKTSVKLTKRDITLTPEERKQHCLYGYETILQFEEMAVAKIALEHHETFDGTGFPQGLRREGISLYTKIVQFARTYANYVTQRPGRLFSSTDQAYDLVITNGIENTEPQIFHAFCKWIKPYPIGSFVELSDRSIGIVIRQCPESVLTPIVFMLEANSPQYEIGSVVTTSEHADHGLTIKKIIQVSDTLKAYSSAVSNVSGGAFI